MSYSADVGVTTHAGTKTVAPVVPLVRHPRGAYPLFSALDAGFSFDADIA
ncbi:hypothetical protein [Paraburkholderia sp. DGU8]|jgi:hypothetical protein